MTFKVSLPASLTMVKQVFKHSSATLCFFVGLLFGQGYLIPPQVIEDGEYYSSIESESPDRNFSRPLQKALVFTSFCSGSQFSVTTLNTIEGINFGHEEMVNISLNAKLRQHISWPEYRSQLDNAFHRVSQISPNPSIVGFKLMFDQVPPHLFRQFGAWLNEESVVVIHLRRAAALQLASHMQKVERGRKTGKVIGHYYHKTAVSTLHVPKKLPVEPAYHWIKLLEENQNYFASFLRVHASCAAVFEVQYEELDGPMTERWVDAIVAFFGLPVPWEKKRYFSDVPVKVGSSQCSDRLDIFNEDYTELEGLVSREICLKLKNRRDVCSSSAPENFIPPAVNCRYTGGNCGAIQILYKKIVANTSS